MTELTDMINQFEKCKHCINFCYNNVIPASFVIKNGFEVYCELLKEFKIDCEYLEVE